MKWDQYFNMLKDWKLLPAYKVEPRVDSLIGFYLRDFLSDFLKTNIVGIIPEFPIRLGTIKPSHEGSVYADRSYKVDFLAVANNDKNYLVEFKTDSKSRREGQDLYLTETMTLGTESLINGMLKISSVSTYKKKYNHLKEKAISLGLLDQNGIYTGLNPTLEIIYVQPSNTNKEEKIIDFEWIANWLKSNYQDAEFEKELAETLLHWSND